MTYTTDRQTPSKPQLRTEVKQRNYGADRDYTPRTSPKTTKPFITEIEGPSGPGEWSIAQIEAALSSPIPDNILKTKTVGTGNRKQTVQYLSWTSVNRILSKFAPGWSWEITQMTGAGNRVFLAGQISIPTCDGIVTRSATGTENLTRTDRETGEILEIAYGDPSSNSESMAFRRAAARFCLALYLYKKK